MKATSAGTPARDAPSPTRMLAASTPPTISRRVPASMPYLRCSAGTPGQPRLLAPVRYPIVGLRRNLDLRPEDDLAVLRHLVVHVREHVVDPRAAVDHVDAGAGVEVVVPPRP